MNIEQMKIKDIKPYEKNAKKHNKKQIDNVAESIEQFGFAQPLVVDKDNVLIIGHCRLLAAKQLKLREVPVVRMDELTQEQVDKLRLLDNKLNESEWDFDLLEDEINALNFDGFEIDWGIDEEDIDNLVLDDEEEKTNVIVTINCSNFEDYESVKERLQNLADEINATIAIKMQ